MTRTTKIATAAVAIVTVTGVLAVVSYEDVHWDGGFPSGEFRVTVRDRDNQPVKNAVLRVYHAGTRQLAIGYPLDNDQTNLVSNENGRITAIREHGGLQFGGHYRRVFGIKFGDTGGAPSYDCEITADGFKPLKFDFNEILQSPHHGYEDFPKTKRQVDGREIELKVYDNAFVMER
jgi:hypothetical protein